MPHFAAYSSARSCVAARDADEVDLRRRLRAGGMTSRLMSAVEMIPHFTSGR